MEMEKKFEKGREIIKTLINGGFEAYFIGECVRNTIMEIPFSQIEITTNALPEDIEEIFNFTKVIKTDEETILLYFGDEYLITTFSKKHNFPDKRTPKSKHYSKNLLDELACRDFTINALTMSHNKKVTDAYLGFEDIKKKTIRTIGNPKVRFEEDPARILIAISLISQLGFRIHKKTHKAMKAKRKLLHNVPPRKLYTTFKKIIEGTYSRRAFSYLYEYGFHRYLPFKKGIRQLAKRRFKVKTIDEFIACCALVDEKFNPEIIESADNKEFLYNVLEFAYRYPKLSFSDYDLFKYGLNVALTANRAAYLAGKSKNYAKKIKKRFDNLVIKNVDDLAFSNNQILMLANDIPLDDAYKLIDEVCEQILIGELLNEEDQIKIYCINALKKKENKEDTQIEKTSIENQIPIETISTDFDVKEVSHEEETFVIPEQKIEELASAATESELEENLLEHGQVVKTYTEMKINLLEKKLLEQERLLKEKDERLYQLEKQALQQRLNLDIDRIVQQNLETLRELNYLDTTYSEKIMLGRELQKVYRQFLSSIDEKYREILSEDKDNEKD